MKRYTDGSIDWRIFVISFVVVLACASAVIAASDEASTGGPKQEEYTPPSGQGPILILLSGASGVHHFRSYAADVARFGYYTILLDCTDVYSKDILKRAIEQAQSSSKALPGKATVIGFSMGGAGALTYAASMPDLVSAVIAYYPMTEDVAYMRSFAARFQVPILVLAGEKDTHMNCCPIESMRAMEAAAKESGKSFELVVYPNAGHGFNLVNFASGLNYREQDAADAWQRTTKMLRQYQPLR
jgi:dienelactone hydrolase